jgi:hypothetical protein
MSSGRPVAGVGHQIADSPTIVVEVSILDPTELSSAEAAIGQPSNRSRPYNILDSEHAR